MQQQSVYFHTTKNLSESKEILEQEEIQIILKTNSLYLKLEDLTEEEQKSWLKGIKNDLEDAADGIDIFYKQLKRFHSQKEEFPKNLRNLIEQLPDSDFVLSDSHRKIIQDLADFEYDTRHLSYFNNIRSRDISRIDQSIRCSCIIARKGDDLVRYLEFLRDPVVTITGKNAAKLKSVLEKKF